MIKDATLTVHREDQDITVYLVSWGRGFQIREVFDEDGNIVKLTPAEQASVRARAVAGEDETGR